MTIATPAAPLSYSGDGSTTAFSINFKYFVKSDVVATLRDSAGAETVWVLGTNYTLSDAGVDAGGTLTAITIPATNETLVITLEPPNVQSTNIPRGGSFPASSVEDSLDIASQRDAKIQEILDRTLRVPRSDTRSGSQLEIPNETDRASEFLNFNATGDPTTSTGTGTDAGLRADLASTASGKGASLVGIADTAENMAALKAFIVPSSAGYYTNLLGYTSAGDGGGGLFRWDSSDLSTEVTADTQTGIYVPPDTDSTGASGAWVRQHQGKYNVRWFGAAADGVTDDYASIQATIDLAIVSNARASVFIPAGFYLVKTTLDVISTAYLNIEGESLKSTYIHHDATTGGTGGCIRVEGTYNIVNAVRKAVANNGVVHLSNISLGSVDGPALVVSASRGRYVDLMLYTANASYPYVHKQGGGMNYFTRVWIGGNSSYPSDYSTYYDFDTRPTGLHGILYDCTVDGSGRYITNVEDYWTDCRVDQHHVQEAIKILGNAGADFAISPLFFLGGKFSGESTDTYPIMSISKAGVFCTQTYFESGAASQDSIEVKNDVGDVSLDCVNCFGDSGGVNISTDDTNDVLVSLVGGFFGSIENQVTTAGAIRRINLIGVEFARGHTGAIANFTTLPTRSTILGNSIGTAGDKLFDYLGLIGETADVPFNIDGYYSTTTGIGQTIRRGRGTPETPTNLTSADKIMQNVVEGRANGAWTQAMQERVEATDVTGAAIKAKYSIELNDGSGLQEIFNFDFNAGEYFTINYPTGKKVLTDGTRPSASTVPAGVSFWNSDDNFENTSDGTNWRDPAGAVT